MPKGLTYRQYRRRQKKYGLAEVAEAISVSPKVKPAPVLGLETLEKAKKPTLTVGKTSVVPPRKTVKDLPKKSEDS